MRVTTVIQSPLPNWIGYGIVVDVDVGEDAKHLPHHRGVGCRSVDRLCVACDVRDHVGVVDRVQHREVAVVEGVVALLHEREEVGVVRLVSVVAAMGLLFLSVIRQVTAAVVVSPRPSAPGWC